MTRAELLALAERVEKITGAERSLDRSAALAARITTLHAPAYTASLDAAASLVPEGMCWSVTRKESGLHVACVWRGPAHCCRATQTAALALTAAALRAMAEEAGDD